MGKINIEKYLSMDDFMDSINPKEEPRYKLVRESDGLTKQSLLVMWIEYDENGRYKRDYNKPEVGRGLLMSPFNQFFTWQTTPVTEIVEEREGYVKFKTKNSNYELIKL